MNKNIKQLFFLIKDNKVLLSDSNLKEFVEAFPKEIAGIRSYDYFFRNFGKAKYFQFEFNKSYFLQKVEYKADAKTSA